MYQLPIYHSCTVVYNAREKQEITAKAVKVEENIPPKNSSSRKHIVKNRIQTIDLVALVKATTKDSDKLIFENFSTVYMSSTNVSQVLFL